MPGRKVYVKHLRRPKKTPAEKRRRTAVQKRRLVALGVPEATVAKLQADVVRAMVRLPGKIKIKVAATA